MYRGEADNSKSGKVGRKFQEHTGTDVEKDSR